MTSPSHGGDPEFESQRAHTIPFAQEVLKDVLRSIKPDQQETERLAHFVEFITKKVEEIAERLSIELEVMLVGSAARGTWIRGEHDLDLFLAFDPSETRAELELNGIEIGRAVVNEDYSDEEFHCVSYEKEYAEHPYIRATFEDREGSRYEVDIVPCFAVSDPTKIESAVDRTPFHTRYVLSKIRGLEDEVRLLKQFMKGMGVYGSELRRQGFSGYLTELLVIRYGSFLDVIKAAATSWKKGTRIDIESHGRYRGDDPLVVIDPVDPMRNVAAALSLDNLSRFIDGATRFLERPGIEFFFPPPPEEIDEDELREVINERGTRLLFIVFDRPPVVDDILFPQLRRSAQAVVDLLHREGFRMYRGAATWADSEHAVILLELEVSRLPGIKKHTGPPVWSRKHASRFRHKYKESRFGVYIENGRYVVEIKREHTDAKELLNARLREIALGKNLKKAPFAIIDGEEIMGVLKGKEFKVFLRGYFFSHRDCL